MTQTELPTQRSTSSDGRTWDAFPSVCFVGKLILPACLRCLWSKGCGRKEQVAEVTAMAAQTGDTLAELDSAGAGTPLHRTHEASFDFSPGPTSRAPTNTPRATDSYSTPAAQPTQSPSDALPYHSASNRGSFPQPSQLHDDAAPHPLLATARTQPSPARELPSLSAGNDHGSSIRSRAHNSAFLHKLDSMSSRVGTIVSGLDSAMQPHQLEADVDALLHSCTRRNPDSAPSTSLE